MREEQGKCWLAITILICSLHLSAQEISVKGGFLEDSLLIGNDVNFWISAYYPHELEMIFPDSLSSFDPFEFSEKVNFPTEMKDGLAYDSTIYTLQSFEIDKIQYLKLAAIVLKGIDSVRIETPLDSIYLTEMALVVSDSTKLKTNLDYQIVDTQFNYPLLYYILGGSTILIIVLLLIFGKKVIKWFKLRKLRIRYEQFSEVFNGYVKNLKVDPEPDLAKKALVFWKNYQQQLDSISFSVMTTKEILVQEFALELKKPLMDIDRVVYGKKIQENIFQDFEQLDGFTQHRYAKKVEEIKNEK